MNKTFQWNGEKFYFSALEAETTRKFIPEATKTAKAGELPKKTRIPANIPHLMLKCFLLNMIIETIPHSP